MRFLFIIFIVSISLQVKGQQKVRFENQSIQTVLQQLENQFDVRFSYNNSVLREKNFSYTGTSDLSRILEEIQQQCLINFEFIDPKNIIVTLEKDVLYYEDLDEVTVTSEYLTFGFDQNQNDGSITLNPKKQGVLPGLTEADVLQSLQLVPGISSPTESATNIHIRGNTPDQNLVLWDGIKMYHQGHLFGMISAFNPNITDRVQVYKSGTSVKYSEHISGVIDMYSADNILQTTNVGIGANLTTADAFLKVPLINDKLGVLFSARRALTDVFDSPTYSKLKDKVFQNTKIEQNNVLVQEEDLRVLKDLFYFTDINAKLLWKISDRQKISFSSLFVNNTLDYTSVDLENEGSNDKLNLKNNGFSLTYENTLNEQWKIASTLQYSDYNSDYNLTIFNNGDDSYNKINTIHDFGALVQTQYHINQKSNVTLGADFSDHKVNFNINFPQDSSENESENNTLKTTSIFSEYALESKLWNLRAGVRANFYSIINKPYLEPRLYVGYQLNDFNKINFSVEVKNQTLSQLVTFEFNELGLDNNIWTLTDNDDIPILRNYQLNAGYNFNKNGWKIDIESYYKQNKGLTSFTRGFSSSSVQDNYTSGNSETYGLDVLIKKRINRFRSWVSYSLSKTDFSFENLQSATFPGNFDQRHVITFAGSYKLRKLQFSLGWYLATGKPFSKPDDINSFTNDDNEIENLLEFESLNNNRLPTYHKLDTSITYDFKIGRSKSIDSRVGVSLLNIYNRRNELDRFFDIEDNASQNEITQQTIVGLGITPNFLFRISF
ncbi:TonB-dependent receptor plug domain-containing protein [Tenacibaculum agarivorans]|uniref:TonB-dependent receptor plug domain-containing protein n=1 Tax=Tenacibaculum agarivorans TaxID=1908389 RepID=UPI00094B8DEC|nr:TonB-dependent receptor plug domain-containing protein [Tenacibaculum agarivorans]